MWQNEIFPAGGPAAPDLGVGPHITEFRLDGPPLFNDMNQVTIALDTAFPNANPGQVTVTRDTPGGEPVILGRANFRMGDFVGWVVFDGDKWIPGDNVLRATPSWGARADIIHVRVS